MKNIESFYKGINGKSVAFIGAGVSHKECIEKFAAAGAVITLCDKKADISEFGDYGKTLTRLKINLSLGKSYLDGLNDKYLIMRTPGFELFTPQLVAAQNVGSIVTSEMELFFEHCPCKTIAVTGSDGKTTTTTLIAEMLREQGLTVHLGGNLGRALLPIVQEIKADDIAVVELSSFQLISMRQSPNIAIVTNVTPNHLDHHKDMQEYIDAKRNILLYQDKQSRAVLGFANDITRAMQADVVGECAWFTRFSKIENGAHLNDEGELCLVVDGEQAPVVHKSEIALRGEHNIENMLAAMAAVDGIASRECMTKVAKSFAGVEHRIEPVRKVNGVIYYNDSIATSPTRVIAGLRAFEQKLIIIAGGYDKNIPFEPLAPVLLERVKTLILIGNTADKIEKAVRECEGFGDSDIKIIRADSLTSAVQIAHSTAKSGDIVSLSPACASFDSYPNFEERGKHYKDLVMAIDT